MLLDCTHCQARVNAEQIKIASYRDYEIAWESYQITLLRCPECKHLLIAEQSLRREGITDPYGNVIEEDEWGAPSRAWPEPVSELAFTIPETIRACLLEASKCLHATAYTACVAMSGRAVEAMCRHFGTKDDTLFEGLKELHQTGIIDKRLYEWGDELRKHRNLASHASGAKFNLTDAKDLYDFATAICDYVFVLTAKFESFKKRQAKADAAEQK
jgi:hypothetical protein